ncbi:MAG: JAB domain-containing protein [Cytophagaceae bacterium]
MVHNHPSGELEPSYGDIQITDKMVAIGKFVNVPVIDHLIITKKDFYSFIDSGLLSKIEKESKYDLTFSKVDSLKEEIKSIESKKATEMAKKMLEDNLPIEAIENIRG